MQQLKDNIKTYEECKPLSAKEMEVILGIADGPGAFIAPMALASVDADKQPECCINCHSCEKVCPQTIHIPEELKKFATRMGR